MKRTIISSDWYNALYEDGVLVHQAKPDYLDAETMHTLFSGSEAAFYSVDYDDYDDILGGEGYPYHLSEFPLDRCNRWA
jgi:hypothetical protein